MKMRFVKIPFHIARGSMTDCERSVYVITRSFGNKNGENCFPSHKAIAKIKGCSERTIRRILREMKENGLIDWKRGYSRRANTYIFNDTPSIISNNPDNFAPSDRKLISTQLYTYNKSNELGNKGEDLGFTLDER